MDTTAAIQSTTPGAVAYRRVTDRADDGRYVVAYATRTGGAIHLRVVNLTTGDITEERPTVIRITDRGISRAVGAALEAYAELVR